MRYLELFAGAGGLSMGLERAGMTCVAHAEIEMHARAVLRHHWPATPLHGDVKTVDWTAYAGRVDVVAGGSPCQDLSVAGKRAGLAGARSGLFYEQLRAWDDTQAPYILWENVDGARSSNNGWDFAAILSALVGATIPVPEDGWQSAGVAAGATGVAAWRVLDLQHFGPPQRRRRLFVVGARAGGADPAEILALTEGLCGHPSPRERSRQGVTSDAASRAGGGVIPIGEATARQSRQTHGSSAMIGQLGDPMFTLTSKQHAVSINNDSRAEVVTDGVAPLRASGRAQAAVMAFEPRYYLRDNKTGGAPSDLVRVDASIGKNGDAVPWIVGVDIAPTLLSRDYKGPGSFRDGSLSATVFPAGRPRRLMPVECERLMSWPDGHTATGVREDGTTYTLSDTARYRLCGNGVGSVVAEWIGRQMMAAAA